MTDSDVRETIMAATYDALCEQGYSDLTAQDIADRTDKSKASLFYHYDSKADLLADFVAYLLEWFDDRIAATESLPPVERLALAIDWFLYGSTNDDRESVHAALLELRTQAPHNEQYRDQLRESDDRLRASLEGILADGIDAGQFVDHDTGQTATLLLAAVDGARTRQITLDREQYLADVRSAILEQIVDDLLAADVENPAAHSPPSAPVVDHPIWDVPIDDRQHDHDDTDG
ncbi:TetR/AcrR family transcriptional regulator [Salinadaptatus halalkaliphilus]|uniref:TetR/AcrR family transcriptional regulator n=1 Tax=Salinadaptatus halalkaliphilus TaxID=2419781 RepID=A0A4V3VLF6_9EURY|nr:TetR/AcrR family transcriptional regulator [Salinadaptatus halalkaliphilus]THE65477.1 TetR/AcrR family transcriptional regulator [Salinadaptatus halalkaliphilus]